MDVVNRMFKPERNASDSSAIPFPVLSSLRIPQRTNFSEIAHRAACALIIIVCFGIFPFADAASAEKQAGAPPADTQAPTQKIDDFSQIQWGGAFRVLVPGEALARTLTPIEQQAHRVELELIGRFAKKHYLLPIFVPVERREGLIPALISGDGHVIAANLRVTPKRKTLIAFTEPIYTVREQLVVRAGDNIRTAADLRLREIAVRERSSFWNVIQEARKRQPEISVRLLPEQTSEEEILRGVVEGRYDMAAVDVTAIHQNAEDWQSIKIVPGLFEDDAIAWIDQSIDKLAVQKYLTSQQVDLTALKCPKFIAKHAS